MIQALKLKILAHDQISQSIISNFKKLTSQIEIEMLGGKFKTGKIKRGSIKRVACLFNPFV